MKKTNPALATGTFLILDRDNHHVLSWMRKAADGSAVLVSANFTAEPESVNLGDTVTGSPKQIRTLLKTPDGKDPSTLNQIELAPFGVFVGAVQ